MRGPQPWRTNRARVLRSSQVRAEDKLWDELRGRRLSGFKFVRQAAIGPYFADFLCREKKLVVEVDGGTHGSALEIAKDAARTATLELLGYRVLRVDNEEVERNVDGVLMSILHELER